MKQDAKRGAVVPSPASAWARRLAMPIMFSLSACGGSDDSPLPATTPTLPVFNEAALRLYESARVLAVMASPAEVLCAGSTGPCLFGSGALQATLDGGVLSASAVLPTGNHTLRVNFANYEVYGMGGGFYIDGTASMTYTKTTLDEITAIVSAHSMRGRNWRFRSDLADLTADGSGTWKTAPTSAGHSATAFTPAIGSRLINNLTTNVATFGGGTYSQTYLPPPQGASAAVRIEFSDLSVAINGTPYVLNGALSTVNGFTGAQQSNAGEVHITSNKILVARIYGDATGRFTVEVLRPLIAF